MKDSNDYKLQEKVFERKESSDSSDLDAFLYQAIDQSLAEDVDVDLSAQFVDNVVEQAMSTPLWKRMLNGLMLVIGVLVTGGILIGGGVYLVGVIVPSLGIDMQAVWQYAWLLVGIVLLAFGVELADMLLVRKTSFHKFLSLFE